MSCPQEPVPLGWRVWRGAVPSELTQLAIRTRDQINVYAYGQIAQTVDYNGRTVGVWKSHHQWTYRNGKLVTGVCIPGVSLLVKDKLTVGEGVLPPDSLETPDPNAAIYVDAPTDWSLVAAGGVAIALVVAGFWWALRGGR